MTVPLQASAPLVLSFLCLQAKNRILLIVKGELFWVSFDGRSLFISSTVCFGPIWREK